MRIWALLAVCFVSQLAWGNETVIWQGYWAQSEYDNLGIKNLLLSISKSAAVENNETNVFITFPIELLNERTIIASKEDFLERYFNKGSEFYIPNEFKNKIQFRQASEASWSSYVKQIEKKPAATTVITLGHGSKDETRGLNDDEKQSFKATYLYPLAKALKGKFNVKYISESCYSSNHLTQINDELKRDYLICGATSFWNLPSKTNGTGPIALINNGTTLNQLTKNTSIFDIQTREYGDGLWLSSLNFVEQWFDNKSKGLRHKLISKKNAASFEQKACQITPRQVQDLKIFVDAATQVLKGYDAAITDADVEEFLSVPYQSPLNEKNIPKDKIKAK